jgi:hypothetical protein
MKAAYALTLLATTWFCVFPSLARADDGTVALVPEADLSKVWRAEKAGIVHLELSGSVRMQYGCANVGFIIEPNGKVSSPLRLLAYRADRTIPAWDKTIQVVSSNLRSLIPTFAPATGDNAPSATYTSISIPFIHAKLAKSLTPEQATHLDRALQLSCRITDLASRLTATDKAPQQLEPLPALQELMPQSNR